MRIFSDLCQKILLKRVSWMHWLNFRLFTKIRLISDAHIMHIFVWKFFWYNTLLFDQVSISTIFTFQDFKEFVIEFLLGDIMAPLRIYHMIYFLSHVHINKLQKQKTYKNSYPQEKVSSFYKSLFVRNFGELFYFISKFPS